jgi:hypothetical protein
MMMNFRFASSMGNRTHGSDSWSSALLSAFPHLYLALIILLASFIHTASTQSAQAWIEALTIVLAWSGAIILIIVFIFAWRNHFPRWIGSYIFYAFIAAAAPPLWIAQEIWHAYALMDALLSFVYILLFVFLALWIFQRDSIKGLLTITPVAILAWYPVLEFIPNHIRNPLNLAMMLSIALLALLITRQGNWQRALWMLIIITVLIGLPIVYFRTFHHNIPSQYADPATILALFTRYSQSLFWSLLLVVGLTFLWFLKHIADHGDSKIKSAYKLAVDGILINLLVNFAVARGYSFRFVPFHQLLDVAFFVLMILSAAMFVIALIRLLKIELSSEQAHPQKMKLLLLGLGIAFPLVFMFPIFDSTSIYPSMFPFGWFESLNISPLIYSGVGLIWLLLLAWVITSLKFQSLQPDAASGNSERNPAQALDSKENAAPSIEGNQTDHPIPKGSRSDALYACLFFFMVGLVMIQMEIPPEWNLPAWFTYPGWFLFALFLFPNIGVAIGWIKSFPRWSYAYILFAIVMSLYMKGVTTPGLELFGVQLFGRQLWGLRAWIPFYLAVVIGLIVTRSFEPLFALFSNIREDWTLASFSLFSCLPWFIWVCFDEIERSFSFPFMVVISLIFLITAWFYMRSAQQVQRALILLLSAVLTWALATAANAIYWNGRIEYWIPTPDHWYLTVFRMTLTLGPILVIIFLPALIGILRSEPRVHIQKN